MGNIRGRVKGTPLRFMDSEKITEVVRPFAEEEVKKISKDLITKQEANVLIATNVADKVKGIAPFEFGIDSEGNYGYKKEGADTVIPFNSSKIYCIAKDFEIGYDSLSNSIDLSLIFPNDWRQLTPEDIIVIPKEIVIDGILTDKTGAGTVSKKPVFDRVVTLVTGSRISIDHYSGVMNIPSNWDNFKNNKATSRFDISINHQTYKCDIYCVFGGVKEV